MNDNLAKRVERPYKEGWYVCNIAHITGAKEPVVREILEKKGYKDIK